MEIREVSMKKRKCALLLMICMLTGIIGCGKPQPGGTVQYDGEEMEMLRSGVNGFSYQLFERLEGEENVFFSPYHLFPI